MKYWHLIGILALASCQRHKASYSADPWLIEYKTIPGGVYVFMGQSNSYLMYNDAFTAMLNQFQIKAINGVSGINCAVSGSLLSSWAPGAVNYQNCLDKVHASGQSVAGIVFWQGEQEATFGPASVASSWDQNFTYLMNNFRSATNSTSVKVVYIRISNRIGQPFMDQVRHAQENVFIPNGVMVDVDDVPLLDAYHYTPDNYQGILSRVLREF